jgi:hypothetical protein
MTEQHKDYVISDSPEGDPLLIIMSCVFSAVVVSLSIAALWCIL